MGSFHTKREGGSAWSLPFPGSQAGHRFLSAPQRALIPSSPITDNTASILLWCALPSLCTFLSHFTELTFTVGLACSLTPVFSKAARNHCLVPPLVFPDQNVIYTNLCTFHTIKQLLYFPLNTSGVEHNPKGTLRKQCLPKGVLNAQKCALYFSKGTCQNPADTSSIEKYLPSAISSRISLPFYMVI